MLGGGLTAFGARRQPGIGRGRLDSCPMRILTPHLGIVALVRESAIACPPATCPWRSSVHTEVLDVNLGSTLPYYFCLKNNPY